jgi:hypothetical protein
MRPCTPHFVLGVDNAIMTGRHFYATSTIAQTCYGIIHTFVMNHVITNTQHNDTRTYLRRMLRMWTDYVMENRQKTGTANGRLPCYPIFTLSCPQLLLLRTLT